MSRVGIVVDSTADLDPEYYAAHDVVMVPLTVRFGEEAFLDWTELKPDQFYARLVKTTELPKTSQPSVKQFGDAYGELAERCDSIISMHLSSRLSGTVQSAEIAARESPVPVAVIDTKLASLGIALTLDEAVAARDRGASHDELVRVITHRCSTITTLFYVETLRYLEMGGRIGKASALVGALLRIRPILKLDREGVVAPYKKVKGAERVYAEFVNAVKSEAAGHRVKVGLVQAVIPNALDTLKTMMSRAALDFEVVFESPVGSVIGTYLGPGAFGVIFYVVEEGP